MRQPRFWSILLVWVCLGVAAARAEQSAPRDLWPQAPAAADTGDVDAAIKKTNELTETGKSYGIKTYPLYATSAVSFGRQAEKNGNKPAAEWAYKAADQLDPTSASVPFARADRAAEQKQWPVAMTEAFRGITRTFATYRTRLLSRADLLAVLLLALGLTTAIFSVTLFIRYGRAMSHDFRELISTRFRGGSVSVLAFALLFLPIFLWLGPVWLVFYWFIIFFGYANTAERTLIVVLCALTACAPIALDYTAHRIAGVDSPVVESALAGAEQAYEPEALHRLQELAGIVPDNATLQLLLGNLAQQEGNEQDASVHYRRSLQLRETAGAHVNLGNLHFLDNDFSAAITEYEAAERLDSRLAIAFYNNSVASGETYRFDEQAKKLDQAKKIDRTAIERLSQTPPPQKIVMYTPPVKEAWTIADEIARRGVARSLFGNYSYFDPLQSALNPITIGALLAIILGVFVWGRRRRNGFAGACIKCGRTFCHRCKSARESATYCTQCIHIYLKRDGVSLDTKRAKLEEVQEHHGDMTRRNRLFATFLPGSAQILEGRTVKGVVSLLLFLLFVSFAVLTGRLAPVLSSDVAKMLVRGAAILLAVITWFFVSLPVYRRRMSA